MTEHAKPLIKVVFASGTDDLNARLIERMREIYPELPLSVVSEFPPDARDIRWVRYQIDRPLRHNLARCRAAFRGAKIRLAAIMLTPNVPLWRLRALAFLLAPFQVMAFNENLNHFMLRPRSLPAILRHAMWRARNFLRWHAGGKPATMPSRPESHAALHPAPLEIQATPFRGRSGKPRVLIASPYVPFPLSHGGAVRMYNLMRRAAESFDQILVAFTESPAPPPPELLEICAQIILVPRSGSHLQPDRSLPDTVAEFASARFHAALRSVVRDLQPGIAQLEFTQMAQYAEACAPTRTILVEHDITFDLYTQLLALNDDWDLRQQLGLWKSFETAAWRKIDRIVVMSQRDRATAGERARTLANGVDLERYQLSLAEPEPRRILFIGSFAHLPNLLAAQFFINEIWPRVDGATLHIIAGERHEFHLARSGVHFDLHQPGIEVEGFVPDVRPAYARATIVIAPLRASAGTNIKILEAMAMAKPIVSTRAGVNGLDIAPGEDFVLAETANEFALEVNRLLGAPAECRSFGEAARRKVERNYNWDAIARAQSELYSELLSESPLARS